MIINPRAEVLAPTSDNKEEIITADINPVLIIELRNAWGFFRDRRPDAYGSLVQ